jgi:hypothetical protein
MQGHPFGKEQISIGSALDNDVVLAAPANPRTIPTTNPPTMSLCLLRPLLCSSVQERQAGVTRG